MWEQDDQHYATVMQEFNSTQDSVLEDEDLENCSSDECKEQQDEFEE